MCACEPGYTCSRCEGTPLDPLYATQEPLGRDEKPAAMSRYTVAPYGGTEAPSDAA